MDLRQQLADVLARQEVAACPTDADADAWLALACEEGVAGLLADRLAHEKAVPVGLRDALIAETRQLAMMELGQHAALVAVLATLHAAAIPVLMLKGTALRCWLYPAPHLRESSDIDLLFASRADAMAAVAVLASLGYGAAFPPDRYAHELLCRNRASRVDLDLHWALTGHPALRDLPDFDHLMGGSVSLPGLSPHGFGLGPADAFLHACVHRASNLEIGAGDRLKWLYDIHLLAGVFSEDGWKQVVRICGEARISGMALAALEASHMTFGTVSPATVLDALRSGMHGDALDASRLQDWRHLQWMRLRALPGWRARAGWLWARAFPSSGYMRELYGRDASRAGLLGRRFLRLMGRVG